MCPDWDQTTPQTKDSRPKKGDKKSEQDARKSGMETKVEQGGGRVNGKLQS